MNLDYKGKRGRKPKGNDYYIENNIVYVVLSNTHNTMVCDIETWKNAQDRTWSEDKYGYARTKINGKEVLFHRIVKKCPEGYVVDHINRNKLDNRDINLRITTPYVNLLNSNPYKNNKCGYKGIKKRRYGYIAQIRVDKKEIYLGIYKKIEDAIKARKEAEEKYHNPIIEKETLH